MEENTLKKNGIPLTTDEDSLRILSDRLYQEIISLRQIPDRINLQSSRPGDIPYLNFLRENLADRFNTSLTPRSIPEVFISTRHDSEYSFDLGYFLDRGIMPAPMPHDLANAREEYYPKIPEKKERLIDYIVSGTVIDHIPVGHVLKLVDPLGLNSPGYSNRITFGDNYRGEKLDSKPKGILKIENYPFKERDYEIVAVYAPGSKVSTISAGKVIRKNIPQVPDRLDNFFMCADKDCPGDEIYNKNGMYNCSFCDNSFSAEKLRYKK